jgi:hypothetical protein
MKKQSTFLATGTRQNQTTMRHYYIAIRMAKMNSSYNTKCLQKCREVDHSFIASVNAKLYSHFTEWLINFL